MTDSDLADALRHRLRERGLVDYRVSAALTDGAVIDSYVICSRCGARLRSVAEVSECVADVASAEEFTLLSEVWISEHRCGLLRCDLRVTLEWPDDVARWVASEPTLELISVTDRASGRTGVLGMTDGRETRLRWFTKTGKRVTKRWMDRRWSGQKMTLFARGVDLAADDVLWDDDEEDGTT